MPPQALPKLPGEIGDFVSQLAKNASGSVTEILKPYKKYEAVLRVLYAQDPNNAVLKDQHVNAVPIFAGRESNLKIRARSLESESENQKSKYIMPLSVKDRRANDSPAVVSSLKDFQSNFGIFSESALSELDWSNVVAAGSSVLTPLLPIPKEHAGSKRSIRKFYHDIFTPGSDVDLFIYGLTEEQALQKIIAIERAIKDSILAETTTIRTKNAITIASQYPTRHIQIVLRIYNSVSEILTGFDVDCSCVAYDGKQVYATPRALAALVTQINQIDLSRRSPSYESRLSKYSRRGFEAYWSEFERDRIDPTIFERSFARTVGLARLLVLEKLPTEDDREAYLNKRRAERGRPVIFNHRRGGVRGNIKERNVDEVADWVIEDDVSNYHSFTIPYGERLQARRIERLLYTKDLLLNAEWNTKEREYKLHRHPAFFGDAEDIFEDCCGNCPKPNSPEEEKVAEEESKNYVSGKLTFLTDNPGRQEIGSFNPITDTDWTEMAYVQETQMLNQAIVAQDLELVKYLLEKEQLNPNLRDFTGRTALHLAVVTSTPEIVQALVHHGAYLIPRLAGGENVMHLAAARGGADIMEVLNNKSTQNKHEANKRTRENDDGVDVTEDLQSDTDAGSETSGDTSTYLKVEPVDKLFKDSSDQAESSDPTKIDVKDDILDPDIVTWDTGCTPAHVATIFGNLEALHFLLNEHGTDPKIPIKLKNHHNKEPRAAILSLVLALNLPEEILEEAAEELVAAGATCSQADLNGKTAFRYFVDQGLYALDTIVKVDEKHAKAILNYMSIKNIWQPSVTNALSTAIKNHDAKTAAKLLDLGAKISIDYDDWAQAYQRAKKNDYNQPDLRNFVENCEQPVRLSIIHELPEVTKQLIRLGADINTVNKHGHPKAKELNIYSHPGTEGLTLLDEVRAKLQVLQTAKDQIYVEYQGQAPDPPKDDSYYLADLTAGTWAHWAKTQKLEAAKKDFKRLMEQHKLQEKNVQGDHDEGKRMKLKAVEAQMDEFHDLESYLVTEGAKTFGELNPEVLAVSEAKRLLERQQKELQELEQKSGVRGHRFHYLSQPNTLASSNLEYKGVTATESKNKEYTELFEAVWTNDIARVAELTTVPRGENKDEPPLTITVTGYGGHNPFTLAVLRGHWNLAMRILSIAQAQYVPKDVKMSYTMDPNDADSEDGSEDSDAESNAGGDRITVYSKLPAAVRNQFTIEDIGVISTLVKSDISPFTMIKTTCLMNLADKSPLSDLCKTNWGSVLSYAILINDRTLFDKLLDTLETYSDLHHASSEVTTRFTPSSSEFQQAIQLGRIEMLGKMISRTCAGIPLSQLAQKTGIKSTKQSKYYQGLSIRGKKNESWAAAHRRGGSPFNDQSEPPLLLVAARSLNIEAFEWLMSDTPLRLYKEYAANNVNDDRLKILTKSKKGFEKTVAEWLEAKSE
jgi:hypothetical protein